MKAGAEDIRRFFENLHIPDGGVYIVGGSLGEAFIAFTTERDAQIAMRYNGSSLKGSQVSLHMSNMAELEHKLEKLIRQKNSSPTPRAANRSQPCSNADVPPPIHNNLHPTATSPRPADPRTPSLPQPLHPSLPPANMQTPAVDSLDSGTAFLLGICTVLHGLQSTNQREGSEVDPRVYLPEADGTVKVSDVVRTPEPTLNSEPGYVRLFGLPASTTKEDICLFFGELTVKEVIVNVKLGVRHCCLVKFANTQDANDALRFNQQLLGSVFVEVRGATEMMWTTALQECENALDLEENVEPCPNPLTETANQIQDSASVQKRKRSSLHQLPYKPPKQPRPQCNSVTACSSNTEYIVMITNLPQIITKTEIKELFGCPNIENKNVLHLLDKEGNRTDTAFLIFYSTEDYDYALSLSGCHVGSNTIQVSPITKDMMRDMMAKVHVVRLKHHLKMSTNKKPVVKRKPDPVATSEGKLSTAAETCLYVRNLPQNVKKCQIEKLFCRFKLKKDNITLLHDSKGRGTGEAVVQFKSQKLAALAHKLHGQDFLGTHVLLTRINAKQKSDILERSI